MESVNGDDTLRGRDVTGSMVGSLVRTGDLLAYQRDPVGSDGSIQYLRLGKIKGDDEGRKVVKAIVIEREAKS